MEQFKYAIELFKPLLLRELDSVEPTQDATARYNDWLSARLSSSVFMQCTSRSRTGGTGKVFFNFPGPLVLFWWLTLAPRWSDYEVHGSFKDAWVRKRRAANMLRGLCLLIAIAGALAAIHVTGIMDLEHLSYVALAHAKIFWNWVRL